MCENNQIVAEIRKNGGQISKSVAVLTFERFYTQSVHREELF